MRISPLNICNFRAGKTSFYTDFDGTFFPSDQYFLRLNSESEINKIKNMYNVFQRFCDVAKEKFSIIITTGRDEFDMKSAIDDLKDAEINFIKPDKYILENGYEEAIFQEEENQNDFSIISQSDNRTSNKLIQPKAQVKNIIENNTNDLVIVAGDDYNDKTMLNPLNYIDIFNIQYNPKTPVAQLLKRKDILDAIKKLPIIFIVAGDGYNLKYILKIKKILDSKRIKKIYRAKEADKDLIKNVKKGMYFYSKDNNEYKNELGIELLELINS